MFSLKSDKGFCSSARCLDIALLILRLVAGLIFVLHGYGKLFGNAPGMTAFTGMVSGLGFPLPGLFAYLAALSEFVGGIALILGLYTCIATFFMAITILVAFVGMKHAKLPMGDIEFMLLGTMVALHCSGPGVYTVKKWLGGKQNEACKMCATGDKNHKH